MVENLGLNLFHHFLDILKQFFVALGKNQDLGNLNFLNSWDIMQINVFVTISKNIFINQSY
jgi:hypothetical protein